VAELTVRVAASIPGLPLPDQRGPLAPPRLHVPVQTVVRHVQLAPGKPPGVGRIPLEDGVPRLEPVELRRPLRPVRLPVGRRPLVLVRICDHGTLGEAFGWREPPVLVEEVVQLTGVVGHPKPRVRFDGCGPRMVAPGPGWSTAFLARRPGPICAWDPPEQVAP